MLLIFIKNKNRLKLPGVIDSDKCVLVVTEYHIIK